MAEQKQFRISPEYGKGRLEIKKTRKSRAHENVISYEIGIVTSYGSRPREL